MKHYIPRPRHKTIGLQALSDDLAPSAPDNKKRKKAVTQAEVSSQFSVSGEDLMSEGNYNTEDSSEDDNSDSDDSLYVPSDCEDCSGDQEANIEASKMEPFTDDWNLHKEPKYIVFHNQLLLLLSIGHFCFSTNVNVSSVMMGSMLLVVIKCSHCKSVREWCSQPKIRRMSVGDILLSGALLFSGSPPRKTFRMLQSINIICHKTRSFFRHQNNHLHPTIQHQWTSQQHALLQHTKDSGLIIGRDARCDSMGHSAKYGSYTAVDLERNKILNVELVQSNQVKSSYHMELQGRQQTFQLFEQFQVKIKALITDRQKQIAAWVRKNLTTVKH